MLQSLPVSGYLLGIELQKVLFGCPDVFSQRSLYPGKIKEVRQQVEEILPPERPYALRIRFGELALPGKILHGTVAYDRPGGEGRAQHQAFEGPAAAQGHIGLAVGKCSAGIDDGPVESQALALVYSDGPGRLQRILAEGALDLLADLPGVLVQDVAGIAPCLLLNGVRGSAVAALHFDHVFRDVRNLTYRAVDVAVLAGGIVLDEHHLRSFL